MGKIQTGQAETGQKIKTRFIESGLNITLGKATYARLPTEDYRSPYNWGDESAEDYVKLSKQYSKLRKNKDIDAQVQDLLGQPPQDMIILRPPPPLETIESAFREAAKVTNAAKTIQSAVRKRRASRAGTNIALLNRNWDGTAQVLLQKTGGGSDPSNPLIPFSGEGRQLSGAKKSIGTVRSRQQNDIAKIIKEGNAFKIRTTPIKTNKKKQKRQIQIY